MCVCAYKCIHEHDETRRRGPRQTLYLRKLFGRKPFKPLFVQQNLFDEDSDDTVACF